MPHVYPIIIHDKQNKLKEFHLYNIYSLICKNLTPPPDAGMINRFAVTAHYPPVLESRPINISSNRCLQKLIVLDTDGRTMWLNKKHPLLMPTVKYIYISYRLSKQYFLMYIVFWFIGLRGAAARRLTVYTVFVGFNSQSENVIFLVPRYQHKVRRWVSQHAKLERV